jgi:hypothetical protein
MHPSASQKILPNTSSAEVCRFSLLPLWNWCVTPFYILSFNETEFCLCIEMVEPAFITNDDVQKKVIALGSKSLKQL